MVLTVFIIFCRYVKDNDGVARLVALTREPPKEKKDVKQLRTYSKRVAIEANRVCIVFRTLLYSIQSDIVLSCPKPNNSEHKMSRNEFDFIFFLIRKTEFPMNNFFARSTFLILHLRTVEFIT